MFGHNKYTYLPIIYSVCSMYLYLLLLLVDLNYFIILQYKLYLGILNFLVPLGKTSVIQNYISNVPTRIAV